jgi:cytoskeletal protein CcmA (bactofilin family)
MSSQGLVNIGPQISLTGEIKGGEDLVIEGRVEGAIDLQGHALHLGPKSSVTAEIRARSVTIEGQVDGTLYCAEKLEIMASGRVTGTISTPRLALEDGARFKGSIDMGPDADGQPSRPIQAPGLSQPKSIPSKR